MSEEDEYYSDFYEELSDEIDSYCENDLSLSGQIEKKKSYDIFSQEEISNKITKSFSETGEILGIDSNVAIFQLVRHYKWNFNRLLENYIDSQGGVDLKYKKALRGDKDKEYDCLVCFMSSPGSDVLALGCGHFYCKDCWVYYLDELLSRGLECIEATCIDPTCNFIVDENVYKSALDPKSFAQYEKLVSHSYVVYNPRIKYCPSPDCEYAIECERENMMESVECICSFRFCFQCADYNIGDHMPATCNSIRDWTLLEQSESENIKWLAINTKKCPQCQKHIEKNGGCMHMTCQRPAGGCGHEFCWLCRHPWHGHDSRVCSTYKNENDQIADLKSELDKYIFFYHRYESHMKAMKMAEIQLTQVECRRADCVTRLNMRYNDTEFILHAAEQIVKNRRALMWSYVRAFFLKNGKEKSLLEHLQEDLERYNEKLTELYEKKIMKSSFDFLDFETWKQEMANFTKMTMTFHNNFTKDTMAGLL